MSDLTTFDFEDHPVRTVTDEQGMHWFNANDVCKALELGNPRDAVGRHVDDDDIGKRDTIDVLGRTQQTNFINESGLYALILGSTKDAAKRFKRWVTSEVLPAIRKTGSYAAPSAQAIDPVASILLIGKAMSEVPGVKPGIMAAATLACIQKNTGLSTDDVRRALPAATEPACTLNATQLGKLIDRTAKATNQLLAAHGLQVRNDRDDWELTEEGRAWGEVLPFSRNGHSGYQILWNPVVAERLNNATC